MTIVEARIDLTQKIADAINDAKLPPTMVRLILGDLDKVLEQEEDRLYQNAISEKESK